MSLLEVAVRIVVAHDVRRPSILEGNHRGGATICPAASQKKATDLLRQMVTEPSFPGREVRRVQAEVLALQWIA